MLGVGAQSQSASRIQGSVIAGGLHARESCFQSTKILLSARHAGAVGYDAGAEKLEIALGGVLQRTRCGRFVGRGAAVADYPPCIIVNEQTHNSSGT